MPRTFTEELMRARRKARLAGRPLSRQEVSGISAGYAETASARLARLKGLDIQERGLVQTGELERERLGTERELQAERLAQAKEIEAKRLEETRLTREAQMRAAQEAGKREETQMKMTGAIAGGTAGWMVGAKAGAAGGPYGMVIGAVVGYMAGSSCIIISSCTSPDSYEVDVARLFRDYFLGPITLKGYYKLARYVVPFINKFRLVKFLIKKLLVDQLVDHGAWIMGITDRRRYFISQYISQGFLRLCKIIGEKEI